MEKEIYTREEYKALENTVIDLREAAWAMCQVAPPSNEARALLSACQPHAWSVDPNHCVCEVCVQARRLNRVDHFAEGEPVTLVGACLDALEWMSVMRGWMMTNRSPSAPSEMWADSLARLDRAIAALKRYMHLR